MTRKYGRYKPPLDPDRFQMKDMKRRLDKLERHLERAKGRINVLASQLGDLLQRFPPPPPPPKE